MAIVMRSFLLLMSVFIFNIQAMHTSSTQVVQWAEKNKTVLVAGSIVTVGGVTAYYLESPKIFAASVVGAGLYVACQSLCNDDEFQARLKRIAEQDRQIDAQYKILNSGVDALLSEQKNITTSAVELSDAAKEVEKKVSEMVVAMNSSLDVSFLHTAQKLPTVAEETQEGFAKNVSICNNISASTVEFKKEGDALEAALEGLVQAGQKAEKALSKRIDERTKKTVVLIDQGTADILKLLDACSAPKAKLSDSY